MLDAFPSGCPSPARIKEERSYHSNSISFLTNRKVVNANGPISPPFVFVSFSASRIKGKEILFFFFFVNRLYDYFGYNGMGRVLVRFPRNLFL